MKQIATGRLQGVLKPDPASWSDADRKRAYKQVVRLMDEPVRRLFEVTSCQARMSDDDWAFFLDGQWYTPGVMLKRPDLKKILHALCGGQAISAKLLLRPVDTEGTRVIDALSRCDTASAAQLLKENA